MAAIILAMAALFSARNRASILVAREVAPPISTTVKSANRVGKRRCITAPYRRSLRGEIVAHRLDLVGEEDELLAAIEVDGEELAAEVLALRDERPRRSPSNDSARECDGARRATARPWNKRHGCLLLSFTLQ